MLLGQLQVSKVATLCCHSRFIVVDISRVSLNSKYPDAFRPLYLNILYMLYSVC